MTYKEVLSKIAEYKTVSLKPSLSRISALLKKLNDPQNSLKVIHIAGTNGKGSVAAQLHAVLLKAGFRTGLFVSPFILDFCERIQYCGQMISKEALVQNAIPVLKAADRLKTEGIPLSQFEVITAIAFLYFKEKQCDYCILETGLGGRYDATNVIKKPLLTVITKISMDHVGVLGNTIAEIADEKAGIIKPKVPVVTVKQEPAAMEIIQKAVKENAAPLKIVSKAETTSVSVGLSGTVFQYNNIEYRLNLLGLHQVENALLAITAVNALLPELSPDIVSAALKDVCHPARMELINSDPLVLLDGAHNPDGAAALAEFLKRIQFKGCVLFGAMKDKNTKEIVRILEDHYETAVTVTVRDNPRAESAENLCKLFRSVGVRTVAAKDYDEALAFIKGKPLVVCGSLYLAADLRPILLERFRHRGS